MRYYQLYKTNFLDLKALVSMIFVIEGYFILMYGLLPHSFLKIESNGFRWKSITLNIFKNEETSNSGSSYGIIPEMH